MGGLETRGISALELLGVLLIIGSLAFIFMGIMWLWVVAQAPFGVGVGLGGFAAIILIFGIVMLIVGIILLIKKRK